MKLVYTDIKNDLTLLLTKEADRYASQGKRVFYIAPNSLSFEKEKKVLAHLPNKASFAITVTRFGQMARYFTLNAQEKRATIDDRGLSMVFYRVLKGLSPQELSVYGQILTQPTFINQLVDLYKELQAGGLAVSDLAGLPADKLTDLALIFDRVADLLGELQLDNQSQLTYFSQQIKAGHLAESLAETVVIVDGFTRFSAEEEALLALLEEHCHRVVVGVYASQTAYQATYRLGNLYQASLDFLDQLAQRFSCRPTYLAGEAAATDFSRLGEAIESRYDYRPEPLAFSPEKNDTIQLWETLSIKEELEHVAKSIRAQVKAGRRYKEVTVLLGDVESYRLPLSEVFDKYAIPYYLGRARSMADHPLVQVLDALERLQTYNFRAEDLLNLVKSGLYGDLADGDIDYFDTYVSYADLKGRRVFARAFVKGAEHFDLDRLNQTRQAIMGPLLTFLTAQKASVSDWLTQFQEFLTQIKLRDRLYDLASFATQEEAEAHQQVWKNVVQLLEQMGEIFSGQVLTQGDFLALLNAGMQSASYRLVPATVDVVTVKSYSLIEPHTNALVYALGMTQGNFPEIVQNVSLLSDEERQAINDQLGELGRLEISSQENHKRNHYVFASLLHAATDQLVLSSPSPSEGEGLSSYLQELVALGLPIQAKNRATWTPTPDDLGSYRGLLSRLADAYQGDMAEQELDKATETYWSVLVRVLRQKLAEQGLSLPEVSQSPQSQPLSAEVLALKYPADQALNLSASSLGDFYNNEYLYFVRHVLRLQEEETIHPDARQHGTFIHRVLERLGRTDLTDLDQEVAAAITQTLAEDGFAAVYADNAQTSFSRQLLEEMLHQTATVLRSGVDIAAQELGFGFDRPNLLTLPDGRQVNVRGKIDRLDYLPGQASHGVVDYKSSDNSFKLLDVYNKTSPQLLTYLAALQRLGYGQLFGAFYLQVQNPTIDLSKAKTSEGLLAEHLKSIKYKGIYQSDSSLSQDFTGEKFSPEELAVLLAYNDQLYLEAAQKILAGRFAINPYSKDGQSVSGDQLKSLTRFEADLHLGQARIWRTFAGFSGKGSKEARRQAILEAMAGQLTEQEEEE